MAGLALAVGPLHLSATVTGTVALVAALVAAGSDSGVAGVRLPFHRRQVNERWLDRYRPWVYGAGFGWQIGCGLATYITSAAVYLMIVLGALTGQPAGGPGRGDGLRPAPGDGRAAHPAPDRSVRAAGLPPPVLRARPAGRSPGGRRSNWARPRLIALWLHTPSAAVVVGIGGLAHGRRDASWPLAAGPPPRRPAPGRARAARSRRDWSPPAGAPAAEVVGPARSSDRRSSTVGRTDRTVVGSDGVSRRRWRPRAPTEGTGAGTPSRRRPPGRRRS